MEHYCTKENIGNGRSPKQQQDYKNPDKVCVIYLAAALNRVSIKKKAVKAVEVNISLNSLG